VALGDSLAHLREHGRDELEPGAREQLGRVHRGQDAGRRRRAHQLEHVLGRGLGVVVIAVLLQEVEEVLARDELEEEEQVGRGLEGAVKRYNVGVGRERLVDRDLRKRECAERETAG
jgi:hypothetical protein